MQIDYSVAQALMQHSVGTVATAIEQHSCYHGRDRFGRLKQLQENEKEMAFKLLADFYVEANMWYSLNSDEDQGSSPAMDKYDCNFDLPEWKFGWPKSEIPICFNVPTKEYFESADDLKTKERNTLLILIGALCLKNDLKYSQRGIAKVISGITTRYVGATVEVDAVRKALKLIPDAVEARMDK